MKLSAEKTNEIDTILLIRLDAERTAALNDSEAVLLGEGDVHLHITAKNIACPEIHKIT